MSLARWLILGALALGACYSYTHPPTWPGDPTQLPPLTDRRSPDGGAR